MARRVYIHVGLHKTGTSYLQQTLWLSRDRLAETGVLVPGESHQFQRFAFWDLLGRRLGGSNQPRVPGSWTALVEASRSWSGHQVVLSDEFLVNARPAHVRRMVRAFKPAEVHVVVTVRDLGRAIGSMWQMEVSKARTWPWSVFIAAVRDPELGPATAGVAFWLRYDLRRVLSTWEAVVPPERLHVVVVPPSGAPVQLLERFAAATNLDIAALTPPPKVANPSVGAAGTELLRRLNERLGGRLNERQYTRMVERVVKPVLRDRAATTRIRLPDEDHGWVTERSNELVEFLKSGPYDVVGDLDDLIPRESLMVGDDPGEVVDADLADAAMAALAATIESYAAYWWSTRRRPGLSPAEPRVRLMSAGRALGYKAKVGALEIADRNRLFARAARLYLRVTSRRR